MIEIQGYIIDPVQIEFFHVSRTRHQRSEDRAFLRVGLKSSAVLEIEFIGDGKINEHGCYVYTKSAYEKAEEELDNLKQVLA